MWTCPKCGRAFQRTNQGHYCGKAPETVEAYIAQQPAEMQPHLQELRNVICSGVSDVQEYIAWSMPTYKKAGKTISFAACKKHISFYAGMDAIQMFEAELGAFATNKNAIYLPYSAELPQKLIAEIANWCLDAEKTR